MKNWKNKLVPLLFALAGVLFLVPAVVKPVIKGEPLNVTYLVLAIAFLVLAIVFVAVVGRKSGGGSGPPSA